MAMNLPEHGDSSKSRIDYAESRNISYYVSLTVDTEYEPVDDAPTEDLMVQLNMFDRVFLYLHPSKDFLSGDDIQPYKTPFAPLDIFQDLNYQWKSLSDDEHAKVDEAVQKKHNKSKNTLTLVVYVYNSTKDIEDMFADRSVYIQKVLPFIERKRRIRFSTKTGSVVLPWQVRYPDKHNGRMRWYNLAMHVVDISAMQGAVSLEQAAKNVGIPMEQKHNITHEEKIHGLSSLSNPEVRTRYIEYSKGDVLTKDGKPLLQEVYIKTVEAFNEIARKLGVESRDYWGLSLGKEVASILTAWLSSRVNVPTEIFYKLTELAGSEGIGNRLGRLYKNKNLLYLSMVDGGRAVKENIYRVFEGVLVDVDISGCYANGLKNQKFAVGNPTIVFCDNPEDRMSLGEFLDKYSEQLIPGLWYARVSYDNPDFKQDVLISKAPKQFQEWKKRLDEMDDADNWDEKKWDEENRLYDANMLLPTKQVHQAALNHDLLQIIQNYSSNQEWGWLRKNMKIDSAAMYLACNQVYEIEPDMMKGLKNDAEGKPQWSTKWFEVDLKEYIELLINERKKHPKKTPMNNFYKQYNNTNYGCIASGFFSNPGTGVSNVVVGNNITARARALAWCMAKALGTFMSITDGGVYNINEVLTYNTMSLDLLEEVYKGTLSHPSKRFKFANRVPLMGRIVTPDEVETMRKESKTEGIDILDIAAWEHCKQTFPLLDIFKYDQFDFESKWDVGECVTKCTIHNKVDYRLKGRSGNYKIALRGFPKIYDEAKGCKVVNSNANYLFDCVEKGIDDKLIDIDKRRLSTTEWREWCRLGKNTNNLTPDDTITSTKYYFSRTPLGARFDDLRQIDRMDKEYQKAKEHAKSSGDASVVGRLDNTPIQFQVTKRGRKRQSK